MRDHPVIEQMEKYGYLEEEEPIAIDYFGNPVFSGDKVAQDTDGEIVHIDDLERFLAEKHGFKIGEFVD